MEVVLLLYTLNKYEAANSDSRFVFYCNKMN